MSSDLSVVANLDFSNSERAFESAKTLSATDFCPRQFFDKKTGEARIGDIVIAIQYGSELGFSPLQALNSINVINQKASLPGDTMLALCMESGLVEDMKRWYADADEIDKTTSPAAFFEIKRKDVATPHVTSFSIADAKRAKKWGNAGPWTEYPKRMLMYRAMGFALRDMFPDVLKGIISTEEAMDYPSRMKDVTPLPAAKTFSDADKERLADDVVSLALTGCIAQEDIDQVMQVLKIDSLRDVGQYPERAEKIVRYWEKKYESELYAHGECVSHNTRTAEERDAVVEDLG